jgi:membrane associated rhomboid family serine protease
MVACVTVFLAQLLSRPAGGEPGNFGFFERFVLDPTGRKWWTLLTSLFLHADGWHLAGNMLFLWVFGPSIEDKFGRIWYLLFYLAAGVASGLAHVLFHDVPAIGASGAIAGVTGAFLVLFPFTHVRVLVLFLVIGVWSIPSWWLIGLAIARDFIGLGAQSGIAHEAHLGGYAFGIAVAMILLATRALPREPYDLFTMARQSKRRAAMKDAQRIHEQRIAAVKAKRSRKAEPVAEAEHLVEFAPDVRAARADVAERLAASDTPAAAASYRRLVDAHLPVPGAILLGRGQQLAVGNALFAAADHQTAARAYEAFLAAYPTDREAPSVRVMLGLINARYLNDPVRARELLLDARAHVHGEQKDLAEELLTELG